MPKKVSLILLGTAVSPWGVLVAYACGVLGERLGVLGGFTAATLTLVGGWGLTATSMRDQAIRRMSEMVVTGQRPATRRAGAAVTGPLALRLVPERDQ